LLVEHLTAPLQTENKVLDLLVSTVSTVSQKEVIFHVELHHPWGLADMAVDFTNALWLLKAGLVGLVTLAAALLIAEAALLASHSRHA
jgi:hypothetical protein